MITTEHLHLAKKTTFTLFIVMLMAYVFMIFLTHTPYDPSWSHLSSEMGKPSNMGGYVGAWLSDIFYTFLGWSAWWIILFLAVEAVGLWWQRTRPIGIARLFGNVFILLTSSALIALFYQWLLNVGFISGKMISSNVATPIPAYQGGIIGIELANRLQNIMPPSVAMIFLGLFLLVAVTYVFNIRWTALSSGLFFGIMDSQTNDESLSINKNSEFDELEGKEQVINNLDKSHGTQKDLHIQGYEQLPLDFENPSFRPSIDSRHDVEQAHEHDDSLLDEFLATSTIDESLLAIDHENEVVKQVTNGESQAFGTIKYTANQLQGDEGSVISVDSDSPSEQSSNEVSDHVDVPSQRAGTFDIWPEDGSEGWIEWQDEEVQSEQQESQEAIDSILDNQTQGQIVSQHQQEKRQTLSNTTDSMLDTTSIHSPSQTSKSQSQTEHFEGNRWENNSESSPTITFAVPEGDASNQIDDLMPNEAFEEDEIPQIETSNRDDIVLAAIDDDEAFKSHSRAMQTARYRESLTPIPELSILDKPDPNRKPSYTQSELVQLSELLEIKLQDFNVKAEVMNAIPGPVVTRFEVELAPGVKASKVTGISRDLARSLSMASLRVVEVIPGKPYIGIEVPNKKREMVRLIELLETEKYKDPKGQISMAMGKDIGGKPIITDLAKAPHMLVAGTTGSGKSVLVNSMLLSMLLKYTPKQLRLILIDPKQLELANYNDIPHLLTPVVTDMTEAASSLSWCVAEMEKRYQLMSLLRVRKLGEFNKKVLAAEKAGNPIVDPLWRPNASVGIDKAPKLKPLPMIVIVADEFADMIMQVGKQAEELITRLAQKSRAAGIHLMLATQRPSVDVITGLIKANIPVRAALRVNSKVDSRTILDAGGAEDMLGNGDMLFLGPGQIEPDRVHGAFVSDEEVNRVCEAWRERGAPDYIDNMADNFALESPSASSGNTSGEDDELYDQAVAFIMETRKVSASSIQRKFSVGYNRAARIVDSMEEAGLVSAPTKSGKRELLM